MNHGKPCPTFAVEVAQLSDLGMRRLNNQDSLAVVVTDDATRWASRGHLMLVADGMGAHAAGELASKLAADNIPHTYLKLRDMYPPAALRQAIREVNALIYSKGQSSIGFQGMGTTCSCLVLLPQGALVAHIGDSRVYRLRGHHLAQLTFDHSLVWEMAAAGRMAEEDVPSYIPKNVITRSLGPHENVNIDVEGPFDAATGDIFLLCTDGLSGQINDAEIGALLHCLSPDEAVHTLVDLANLRGGPDNISVIIARIVGTDAPVSRPRPVAPQESAKEKDTVSDFVLPPQESMILPVTSIAALFALTFCLVNEWWTASIAAGAALLTSLGLLLASRSRHGNRAAASISLGGPYGNGPYRNTVAEPNDKIVASLAEMADKLRDAPVGQGAKIDWAPIEKSTAAGKGASESGDYCKAIRHYSEAIRAVMDQIRVQRLMETDDTTGYSS